MESNDEKKDSNKTSILKELLNFSQCIMKYFSTQSQDYLNLINFLEQITSELGSFYSKIKVPNRFEENSPENLNLNSFYFFQKKMLDKMNTISAKIKKEVLIQLKNSKDEFESDNKNIFFALNTLIEDINTQQNFVDNKKAELKEENEKNNNQIKSKYEIYKEELKALNKLYSNAEKKFKEIKNAFEDNELKKNKLISNCLNLYFKIIHEEFDGLDNQNGEIKNLIKKYRAKPEHKSINDIFPNSKILKMKKWENDSDDFEELNLIENYIKKEGKQEEKRKEIKEEKTNNTNTTFNDFVIPQIVITNNIVGIDDEYMVLKSHESNDDSFIDISLDEEMIKDNITINNFLYALDNSVPTNDLILNIEDVIFGKIGDKQFIMNFCDKIVKAKGENKTLYEYKIFANLGYLTNVLNLILEQISNDLLSNIKDKDYFDSYKLFDKIICIGEKSVCEDTYMCSILSNNKIFKNKNIWINAIKNKIINLLDELCTNEYLAKSKDTVFHPKDIITKKIEKIKIKKIISKLGKLITGKEKNLIELCQFNNYIQYYNKLSSEKRKNVDNNALSLYHGVIKCYIRHITNYNFDLENTSDIISEICNTLFINDVEHIAFYCYYYQDCANTSKKMKIKCKSILPPATIEKIKYIKSVKKSKNIPEQYILDTKDQINKLFIIKKVSKYLEDEDKLKLICLGKYYKRIKKKIYASLFKKELSVKQRVHLWESYLNYKNTVTLFNYKEILKETKEEFFQKANENTIIQINKDLNRTYYRKKNPNIKEIFYNIFISFAYSETKINYVQGINFITGFLYDLTENEEETFHLLISIFSVTQLSDIFNDDDFQCLKTFFYVMERLVYLYLPKIYSKLKDNSIQLSFIVSAYFVSFYTTIYQDLPDNDISFLFHLWEGFFLDGWCSFFSDWLAILKYHEKDIMTTDDDLLIGYLTNISKNTDLFRKEKYNIFCELKKQFKISEELVRNLQEEIGVETGIRKVGASVIIEDFNQDDKKTEKN